MSNLGVYVFVSVFSAAVGYLIGWNAAKHPGKLSAQWQALWAKITHKKPDDAAS